jgi:hypothetical protein
LPFTNRTVADADPASTMRKPSPSKTGARPSADPVSGTSGDFFFLAEIEDGIGDRLFGFGLVCLVMEACW